MSAPVSAAARALMDERAEVSARRGGRIPKYTNTDSFPLSFGQQMVWLSTQLDKTTAAYNRCSAMHIAGRLDYGVLQRALTAIAERHETLGCRIVVDDGTPEAHPVSVDAIPLPVTDLSSLSVESRQARVRELLDAEATRPFDLDTGPLIRAGILREGDEANTLYISTHHIASDGWSDSVMFRELHALYGAFLAGDPSPLPDLTTRYGDFAAWQRRRAEEPEGRRHAAYWQQRLAGAPSAQELPADRSRPDIPGMAGGQVTLAVPSALTQSLESIGRQEGATLAMTTLAAFELLQSRLTGQADTIVGLSLAGRTHSQVEELIGLFSGVVPLRVTVDRQMTFRELLGAVRIAVLEAHEHQDVSVDEILEALPSAQGVRHAEIAQTLFNFRNMPAFEPSLPGLVVRPVETFNGSSVTDLELEVVEDVGGWKCDLRFRTDLYEEATAARLLGHYLVLLESITRNPDELVGRLQLLTPGERSQILIDFSGAESAPPRVLQIHELIREQVRKTPLAVAVRCEDGELTYEELEGQANAVAHDLRMRDVVPGNLVGICMERSLEMVVSLLGILKAGGAFVPLDPDYPQGRLVRILADARPVILLADQTGASLLGAEHVEVLMMDAAYISTLERADAPPLVDHDPSAVACVLYTSGSTGLPKGVLSTHRGIVNNLLTMQQMYGLKAGDCMLQQTSLGFDAAAWEIFWPLMVGARTYLPRPGGQRDADYLVQVITDQRVATVGFSPSLLKLMLDVPGFTRCDQVMRVLAIGQVLSPALQEKFFARMPHAELHNLYGPTETSITVTAWKCERGDARRTVPIGRRITNAEVYILDAGLGLVPIGVAGEIYIGGVYVSNGYHDRPDLTAERFPAHPFRAGNGDRVYRTGDIARFGPDGVIEYIGRRDHQLKIRGVRVELEEVEAALDRLPAVKESIVIAHMDEEGEHRLVAYVAVNNGASSSLDLRRALENELPPQFIPALIVPLEELPHGPNGKIDRAALPDPSDFQPEPSPDIELPRTHREKHLATIWRELLDITDVGTRDSFFDLGGHSLLAVRMLQRVADEIGETISLRAFYDEPTIHAMASLIAGEPARSPAAAALDLPPIVKVRSRPAWPSLFYLNGQPPGGGLYAYKLAPYLPADQGFYLVPIPIFEAPITVEATAARMIELIRAERPKGPYLLGGNCFGATLAFEIAQQLEAGGESVPLVILIHPDARTPVHRGFRVMRRVALLCGVPEEFQYAEFSGVTDYVVRTLREIWRVQRLSSSRERLDRMKQSSRWVTGFAARIARRPISILSMVKSRAPREADERIQDHMRQDWLPVPDGAESADQTAHWELTAHVRFMEEAWTSYVPREYAGRVAIIWPVKGPANPPWDPRGVWTQLLSRLEWRSVPGNHWSMLHQHLEHSAQALAASIERARES
ncbi:MAG TPA: amino acid adenylation domain-containing protein [Gemmatimonadaceae bacterium]